MASATIGVVVSGSLCCPHESDPVVVSADTSNALDFTQPTAPTGATVSRANSTAVYAQTSASTVSSTTGAVYEDRGNDVAGWWVWPSVPANLITAPFDHSNAAWLKQGTPTVTTANVTAPDGTATGDKVNKVTSGSTQYLYQGTAGSGSSVYSHSVWVRSDTPTPSTDGGLKASAGYQQRGSSFGVPGSTWKRIDAWSDTDDYHGIVPAGYTPWTISGAVGSLDNTQTGAVDVWGDYFAVTKTDFPLVLSQAGAQTIQLSSAQAARIVQNGDFAVKGSFISQITTDGVYAAPGDVYIFSAQTPDGLLALRYTSAFQWRLTVRGVDILSGGSGVIMGGWPQGYEIGFDAWYMPVSTGRWGLRISVNGCAGIEISGNTTGGALSTPTSLWLGSNLGASSMTGMWTKWRTTFNDSHGPLIGEFVLVGDSIIERVINQTLTGGGIYSIAEGRSRQGITTLAHAGDTVADQLTAYNASSVKGRVEVRAFYIKVGINDIFTNRTSSQIIADYTSLFNAIRAGNPLAKIVTSTMLPAKTFDVGMTADQYAAWQSVNAWIVANSLGADDVETEAGRFLNDGADAIKARYSIDHLHPLNSARLGIIAPAIRASFCKLGLISA